MNAKPLRIIFCTVAALVSATIGFGDPPTPEQALEYARSVVLVKRVVQGNQIHSYVKEIWRSGTDVGTPPPVGSSYGMPLPYDAPMRFPERDAIVFEFGADRPKGFPNRWGVTVMEQGLVSQFQKVSYERTGLRGMNDMDTIARAVSEAMSVDEVRQAVKNTKPKPAKPIKTQGKQAGGSACGP